MTTLKDFLGFAVNPPPGDPSLTAFGDAVGAAIPYKPPVGRVAIYADADIGSDTNDGRSLGSPLKTLPAAVAQLPNGGPIGIAPASATYSLTAPLNLSGHSIQTLGRAPGGTQGLAVIEHNFNGDMIVCGPNGAFLRNLLLYQDFVVPGRTGAALTATSSASNGGEVIGENLVFSNNDGWERDLILDGSAWATFGIRKCVFTNCQFFGARTAGETIKVTRGVHCKFIGGFIDPAPTVVNQGVKILDIGTTDVQFTAFRTSGDFLSEAAGGLIYEGIVTGTVTCASSSAGNRFIGQMGAFANNGNGQTNICDGFLTWNTIPYGAGWSTNTTAARWAIDPQGVVHLDGRISSTGAQAQINSGDTLPHPTGAEFMVTEGALAFAVVTMNTLGVLSLASPAGALAGLSLAGLTYPTN